MLDLPLFLVKDQVNVDIVHGVAFRGSSYVRAITFVEFIDNGHLVFAYVPPAYSASNTVFDIEILGVRRCASVLAEAVWDPRNDRLRGQHHH